MSWFNYVGDKLSDAVDFVVDNPIKSAVAAGVAIGGPAAWAVAPVIGAMASAAGLGVAGGSLTGAAASSAGLAALGGGSLAAGGLGMAGGTAVVTAAGAAGAGALGGGAVKLISTPSTRSKQVAGKAVAAKPIKVVATKTTKVRAAKTLKTTTAKASTAQKRTRKVG